MPRERSVIIVVLGDFGRSPRMQYHALSLANDGRNVRVVAYKGSAPARELTDHARISFTAVTSGEHAALRRVLPHPVRLAVRALVQALHLFWILCARGARADDVLVQTPPCAPTFTIVGIACALRRMRLIIDWHNLAYTLFAMKYGGERGWMTRILERYERRSGTFWATEHLCVTRAMEDFLRLKWCIRRVRVVRDRAPECFRVAAREAAARGRDAFWRDARVERAMEASRCSRGAGDVVDAYYARRGDRADSREDNLRFVVTSTSWTPDEDFQLLLDAAVEYDARATRLGTKSSSRRTSTSKPPPPLAIIVTGKGPQKRMFEDKINAMASTLTHVAFRTVWLEFAGYPHALANADVGVSLHASSSGLDLPMKVCDMFGASLPVLALEYDVIRDELVDDGVNGVLFRDAGALADALERCFARPGAEAFTSTLKRGAEASGARTWEDNWRTTAAPAFTVHAA